MLNDEKYENLKNSLIVSQRLFSKLNKVSLNAKEIDYDESGLYLEEEETCERHWLKLSSKIVDKLSENLSEYNIELLKNSSLEDTHLIFNLVLDDVTSKIKVDYAQNDAISIIQVS